MVYRMMTVHILFGVMMLHPIMSDQRHKLSNILSVFIPHPVLPTAFLVALAATAAPVPKTAKQKQDGHNTVVTHAQMQGVSNWVLSRDGTCVAEP